MAQAERREIFKVDKSKLFSVITRYEDYPQFVEGLQSVEISKLPGGVTRVSYLLHMMSKEIHYTLDHRENLDQGRIEWTLIESNFFKKNSGYWELKTIEPGVSDVLYTLEIDFKIPVPGLILNRLIKNSLPHLMKSFEKRALI